MARARNIKPAYFLNENLARLTFPARLLFIGLWCLADCEGRLEDRPLRIKASLFPYDAALDVDELLQELAESPERFIVRYAVGTARFIQVENFTKHQNPSKKEREAGSRIPACLNLERHQYDPGTVPEPSQNDPGSADIPLTDVLMSPSGDDSKESSGQDKQKEPEKKPKFSPEAKELARELQTLLKTHGQTTFDRDWLLTSYASCESLLKAGKTPDELRQAMTWAVTEWACRSSVVHFKHIGKALPHWEKRKKPQEIAMDSTVRDSLLTFPFVQHIQTGETFHVDKLEVRPESPGALFYAGSAFPVSMLKGMTEVPA